MTHGNFPDDMSPDELEALRRVAKEALRKRVAALRRALSAEARAARAHAMCERVIAHESFVRARVVMAYSALRFEIDPRAVMEHAWSNGKMIVLPRSVPETGELMLHRYMPEDVLEESGFVVKEPLETAPVVDPKDVDLVLVPGLAFDARGHRLGYGQGYYDRFLIRAPNAVRIGLAFELQLLAEVPSSAHDIPVDYVATDRRVLRCEK